MKDLHKYYKKLEEGGYITLQGTPLKCMYCDSKKITDVNVVVTSYRVDEYDVMCDNCGKITGRWCYGNWTLL